jgi:sec-independent protein translocase protein TatC
VKVAVNLGYNALMSETKDAGLEVWGHIVELRNRLLVAVLAVVAASALAFSFADRVIAFFSVPIGGIVNLVSIEVTENIGVFMRVSLLTGFAIALPVIAYELLAFIMPGLKPNERRWVKLAIPAATVLFFAGAAFTYLVMLPAAIPFLVDFLGVRTTPRISNYIEFVSSLIFWVGISFEAPLVVFILAKIGLVTAKMLLRAWRFAIVIIAVLAAVITPTGDPINMGLLMLPLTALYLLSIVLAALAGKKKTEKEEA